MRFVGAAILFLVCNAQFVALAQGNISGHVIDSVTNQPIPFANIYLASSSFGNSSREDGAFSFKVSLNGKYELIVSCLGYANRRMPVVITGDSDHRLELKLKQATSELRSVTVLADSTWRTRDFKLFKRILLGESSNAYSCTIENPRDVYAYLDKESNTLTAFARKPIVIENRSLGYRIHYDMEQFSAQGLSSNFAGTFRFESLSVNGSDQTSHWIKQRRKAYNGSMTHLLRALVADQLEEEGWQIQIVYPHPRLPEAEVIKKIKYYKSVGNWDSLEFFKEMRLLPVNAHMHSKPVQRSALMSNEDSHLLSYKGTIIATYKNAKDERTKPRPGMPLPFQVSRITFSARQTRIYDNGYFEPQKLVLIEGYLASKERVAEFLPVEYILPSN